MAVLKSLPVHQERTARWLFKIIIQDSDVVVYDQLDLERVCLLVLSIEVSISAIQTFKT
jgi:hypothetical protein